MIIIIFVVGVIVYGNIGWIFYSLSKKKSNESRIADFFFRGPEEWNAPLKWTNENSDIYKYCGGL